MGGIAKHEKMLSFCKHSEHTSPKRASILKASFWGTALRRDVRRELLYTSCSAGSMGCFAFRPCFLHENGSQTLLIPSQFLAAVFGGERCAVRKGDITPLPASRNKRYNTLDLASKIVCQGDAVPIGFPCHETARFLWILPHRKSQSIPIVLRPSLPKGEFPLWTPHVRGTLFPFNPLANETNPVSLDASLKKMI